MADEQQTDQQQLDTAISDMKAAQAAAQARINAKFDALAAKAPHLSAEIADIQAETAALIALAPDQTSATSTTGA